MQKKMLDLDISSLVQGMFKEVLTNIFVSEPEEIKRIANSTIHALKYAARHPIYEWKVKIDNKFPLYRTGTIFWDKYKVDYTIVDDILSIVYARIED